MLAPLAAQAQANYETLTVYDGTVANREVPANISYFDEYTKSQFVIPADDLMEIANGTISSMKFYTTTANIPYITDSHVDVYVKEVDNTAISVYEPKADATIVYQGGLKIVKTENGGELTVSFSQPYPYTGGNLLVGIDHTETGNARYIFFYGTSVPGASIAGHSMYSLDGVFVDQCDFIPKTTFAYTLSACVLPDTLIAETITAREATLTWTGGSGTYDLETKTEGGEWTQVLTESTNTTYQWQGLEETSDYRARVRSVCDNGKSGWRSVSFSTPYLCATPTELTVTLTKGNGTEATLGWTENGSANAWQICLNGDENNLIDANSNPFTLTNLTPEIAYTAKVRAYCNNTDQSAWSDTVTFTPTNYYYITIYDGKVINSDVPAHIYQFNDYTRSQFVIPADDLMEIAKGTISSMKFYTTSASVLCTINCSVDVYLKEVDYTAISAFEPKTDATIVYQGGLETVETGDRGELTITFSEPYPYTGGNLLVGIENIETCHEKVIVYYGTQVDGASVTGHDSDGLHLISADQCNFIPKTTFAYTPSVCGLPDTLAANGITPHEATLTWTGGSGTYNLETKAGNEAWIQVLNESTDTTYRWQSLNPATVYQARVRSVCDTGNSGWMGISFTTPIACPAPTGLAATLTPGNGTVATLDWTENGEATAWQICLNDDENNLIDANTNPFTLTGLTPETAYTAKVRAYCDDIDQSAWSNTEVFTPTNDYFLSVYEGNETSKAVPAFIYFFEEYARSQFVIPATDLSTMDGGTISSMKFYTTTDHIPYTTTSPVDVYVKEVDNTEILSFEPKATATIVYQGNLEILGSYNGGELTISFNPPYPYTGGNLLVGIENTESQGWKEVYFYGTQVLGASVAGHNSDCLDNVSAIQRHFIPRTTFVYTPAGCLPPQNITLGNRTHQTADVSWEGTLSNYAVRHREASGPWSAPTAVADTNMYRITGLTANTDYEVQVGSECYNWSEAVAFSTMAEGKYFIDEGDWCEAGSWVPNSLPTLADNVTLNANATVASGCVAEANSIDLNGNTLTIEDGGQLHHNNDGVHATVEKNITAYTTNSSDGWHFIAHPMSAAVEVSTATDLATGDYDLYAFDQSQEKEWRNFKQSGNNLTELSPGAGYLYAHNVGGTFSMTGTLRPSTEPVEVPLAYSNASPSTATRGWNLVGNPFAVEAYADKSYYTMNTYGTAIEPNAATTTTPIPAGTGVMVKADGEGESVTFSKTAPQSATNNGMLQIAVSQSVEPVEAPTRDGNGPEGGVSARSTTAAIDKAIVSFNKADLLPKFDFNEASAKLYIPQKGQDYAIAYIGAAGEVPVHFKAAKDGEYTLSFHLDGVELDYLHLIDNMTGADVDLLGDARHCDSTYTFTAKTTDYASRFRLVFSTNPNCGDAIGDNAPFAYVSNGNIVITADAGTASLQVIDVMGRVVHCGDARHCVSTGGIPAGVYVLRLIDGEKVRTQKIVVR